jgi:hypothetical protein
VPGEAHGLTGGGAGLPHAGGRAEAFGLPATAPSGPAPAGPFFPDAGPLLARVRAAADTAGLWDELRTDWLMIDTEIMPWSAKAQGLIRNQYAPVGAAAGAALPAALAVVEAVAARGLPVAGCATASPLAPPMPTGSAPPIAGTAGRCRGFPG